MHVLWSLYHNSQCISITACSLVARSVLECVREQVEEQFQALQAAMTELECFKVRGGGSVAVGHGTGCLCGV